MPRFVSATLFFLFISTGLKVQNEFYIPWHGDSLSVNGYSHAVDADGNLYILGSLNSFDSTAVSPELAFGNTLLKIDRNNNLLWEKVYYCLGWQMLLLNNSIYVPYNSNIGPSTCNDTTSIATETTLNAGLLANTITGDTIRNSILYDGRLCGTDDITYSYTDKSNHVYNIYYNDSFTISRGIFAPNSVCYIEKIDANLNVISDTFFYPENAVIKRNDSNSITGIVYDTFSNNYVIADTYGLTIYDANWSLVNTIIFNEYNDSFMSLSNITIAYNADYYAINFSSTMDEGYHHYSYLVVITKNGQLISSQPSLLFRGYSNFTNDMVLTNDNNIFGVTSYTDDTTLKPLILEEMDLFQNVKRKVLLGRPATDANKISVTNNEVIITGTVYLTEFSDSLHPDMIYYYRQSLDEIPLLTTGSNLCDNIIAYPNPATNSINITSSDFDVTYNSTVELFNVLGQKLTTSPFDTKTLSLDLISYPSGIYFLKTRNSNTSCVTKIQKK